MGRGERARCSTPTRSWSRTTFPPFNERVPYVAAVVDLEEGPRVMTNVVDCEFADLRVGMPVEVDYRAISDDITIAVFKPAAQAVA